ncbi:Hypothetical protein LUCI_5199 [Lucifera butyrica]|uniref:Response regulatory domain-containing protein n=1 Tax=Lucifera butyrica TaxID=1351585 RepID=A0A498REI6_9FIRM|nr:response regulator [Lucifera butyrica]VBB09901.1 Hypothetical protein LUCI_5199 [Lucifera butyrica]
MADKIKILIADDVALTRENIVKLMQFHDKIMVAGQAGTAEEAIAQARETEPDVILMDINMPGMDGITATEILATEMPNISIIMMSVQGEQEYLRRAMMAGAKNYLIKPFTGDELLQAIQLVYQNEQKRKKVLEPQSVSRQGEIITVCSSKGGVGKTTIATNLAVALAGKTGASVGVVDADLQFGDVALFLNILPLATIADLVKDVDNLEPQLMERYMTAYSDQVKVLPAPLRPEQAETITGSHLTAILTVMKGRFDYVVVDTPPVFNEVMLSVLDESDHILVVSALDLPTTKNVKLCLEILESLDYAGDKLKLVLNRANSEGGMEIWEVEESLHCKFAATVPSDGKIVMSAVNRGVPFVIGHPEAPVSQSIYQLLKIVTGGEWKGQEETKGMVNKIKRLFA